MALRGRSNPRTYEVGRRIAVGGMGEVYDGLAPDIHRKVAIKRVLKSAESAFDDMKELFLREVAVAATLEHPNVVEVFDAGSFRGDLYMIMEFVEGASLAELLEALRRHKKTLPIEIACGIVAQVARGLAHAHERALPDGSSLGIIHRDIAPENVLISKDGLSKLVDFGLATLAGHQFTTPGTIRGRPRCLSPEQARGERIDSRSDIFALGALMFETVSGMPLYKEEQLATLLWKVTSGAYEPVAPRLPNVDPDLIAILETALKINPRERFRSAREMERALDNFRAQRGMRVDSTQIAKVVEQLMPEVARIREQKRDEEPGELEKTQLLLPADGLDSIVTEDGINPSSLDPENIATVAAPSPVPSGSPFVATPPPALKRTTSPPSGERLRTSDILIESKIPKPQSPARITGDLERMGAFSGNSELTWLIIFGSVVVLAGVVFLLAWRAGGA